MNQFLYKATIVIVVLLVNTVSFGMKRKRLELSSQKCDNFITHIDIDNIYLDQLCYESMPSINVDARNVLNALKELNIPNIDIDIDKLPVYKKLSLLRILDEKRRKKIDRVQTQRLEILLNSLPADRAKHRINDEFKKMGEMLYKYEIDTQDELSKTYGINPHSKRWRLLMLMAQSRNEFDLSAMKEQWSNSTWSPNLSKNLVEAITDVMQKNRLEPTAFDIRFLDYDNNLIKECIAAFYRPITTVKFDKNTKKLWEYEKNRPSLINFHPNLADKNDNWIKHMIQHEVTHGLNGHGIIGEYILEGINIYAGIEYEDIRLHNAYAKFRLAQEISADTSGALKYSDIARCGMSNPYLYPGSYGILAMANTNWIALEKINARECQTKLLDIQSLK